MPLDLADALRRHLLQRFPADRDYPRAALHADGMPPLVATFLERALDRWLAIEREQLRSEWFDFDDPAVREAEERFFQTLAETARVPAEAWKATLGGAIDLVVRFLTIPARALTDALFEGDSEPLPTSEIRQRLRLFAAYLYFPEVAAAYLDKKQPDTLDPATLYDLLDRIDRRIVADYRPEDWLALLAPLFTLARTVPAFDGVPAALLQRFFRAKGHDAVADRLDPHLGTTVREPTLREILADEIGEPSEPEITPPEPPAKEPEIVPPSRAPEIPPPDAPSIDEPPSEEPEISPPDAPEIADPETENVEIEGPEIEGPEIEEPEVQPSESEAPPAEVPDEPEPEAPPHDGRRTTDHEPSPPVPLWQRYAHDPEPEEAEDDDAPAPLWQRFSSGTAAPPPGLPAHAPAAALPEASTPAPEPTERRADTLDALEARVLGPTPPSKRSRFIKQLFRGDAGKYATVLHALDDAGTWTEASQIIARDVFRPFKVNIYGEHAVDFTDAVESRFRR